jgi:hypothetical protein
MAKKLKLMQVKFPTRQEVEASWNEIEQFIGSSGSGRQDTHTVNWLFFRESKPPKGIARYYAHPRYTGEFHIPVANGVSISAVKKVVVPLLRDGFQYVGYST